MGLLDEKREDLRREWAGVRWREALRVEIREEQVLRSQL